MSTFITKILFIVSRSDSPFLTELAEDVKINVKELRQHTNLPIAIGFGIKDSASASSVKEVADGIVVGSVFVDLIGEGGDILKKVKDKTKELSEALS